MPNLKLSNSKSKLVAVPNCADDSFGIGDIFTTNASGSSLLLHQSDSFCIDRDNSKINRNHVMATLCKFGYEDAHNASVSSVVFSSNLILGITQSPDSVFLTISTLTSIQVFKYSEFVLKRVIYSIY